MQLSVSGLVALSVLTVPLTAQMAAGSISDDNVVFNYVSFPTTISSTTGSSNLRVAGAAGSDHLFDVRWCWRLAGDPREYNLHNDTVTQAAPTSAYGSNSAVLQWPNVDNRGFAATLVVSVYSTGATSGVASQRLEMTNNTAAPVVMNLFGYVDFDECATVSGDIGAAVAGPNKVSVTDSACAAGEVFAPGADLYQVAAWPNVRNLLLDAAPNDLAGTGLPFGPADFTGAWQWKDRTIAPGGTLTVYLVMSQGGFVHSGCTGTALELAYGAAKPGTNGLPAWYSSFIPFLGRANRLGIGNGFAGSQPIFLMGAGSASIPFPPFGTILVNLTNVGVVYGTPFDAANNSYTPVPIPNAPALCGVQVFFQGFWVDPGAAGSFAHTGGRIWQLGGLY